MTELRQFDIWIAYLRKSEGTELGKRRPVVILQSDLLNNADHPSTIVCGISSQKRDGSAFLRIPIYANEINGLVKDSYIICDQIRSLDNSRFENRIGRLSQDKIEQLQKTLKTILSLY